MEIEVALTPALKSYLDSPNAGVPSTRLIINEFNYWIDYIKTLPPGANRASVIHTLIEHQRSEYYAMRPEAKLEVKCKKSCSFCCVDSVEITSDEKDLLKDAPIINKKGPACPLLDLNKTCSVYDKRPAACRNREVVSLPALCKSDLNKVSISMILKAEIIASAAMTVCQGGMSVKEALID